SLSFDHVAYAAASSLIRNWPAKSRRIANSLIEKYGPPHEATPTMLIWRYNGQWKKTIVHRDGASHNVPHFHTDILEQTVDEKIRPEAVSEVMKFDGSILID